MKVFFALFSTLLFLQFASAQKALNIRAGNACSFYGEPIQGKVYGFDASEDAQSIITRITDAVGLKPNFEIKAANVPNAMAYVETGKRLILYSENFIAQITNATGTNWAGISVLAHEIAHHLNGHTLNEEGSRPELELEADEFAGFVLAKIGASLEEAQAAFKNSGNANGSATHPAKSARLEAVAVGWKKGKGNEPSKETKPPDSNPTSSDCEEKNRGDLCFENKSNEEVMVEWVKFKGSLMEFQGGEGSGNLTLKAGDSECVEQLREGNWRVTVKKFRKPYSSSRDARWTEAEQKQMPVEKCKAKTYTIR